MIKRYCAALASLVFALSGTDGLAFPKDTSISKSKSKSSGDVALAVPATQVAPRKRNKAAALAFKYPDSFPFPLVGIQFPVDSTGAFAGEVNSFKAFKKQAPATIEQMVNEQLVKSTYLACALYENLVSVLPAKSVVLIPTKLQFDTKNNRVVSFPLHKPISPVVLVELFSDVNLDRIKNPSAHLKEADTFGDRARTIVSMSMPVNGKRTVFAGLPVANAKTGEVGETIESFYNVACNGGKLKSKGTFGELAVNNKQQYTSGSFVALKTDFKYSHKLLASEPAKQQVMYYSNIIVDALNSQNLQKASNALLAEFVDDMDPQLADFLLSGSGRPPARFRDKVEFFNYCLSRERDELSSKQSGEYAKSLWAGEFGKVYRSALENEVNFVKQTAASKRKSTFGSLMAVASTAGAVAGAFAPTYAAAPITGLATSLAISAATFVATTNQLQQQARATFEQTNSASNSEAVSLVLSFGSKKVVVDGDSAEAVRKKILQLYENQFETTAGKAQGVL
jgi:hypothetical protein